jgi:hypothetical protein
MTNRITVALGALLLCVGSTLAQSSTVTPPGVTPPGVTPPGATPPGESPPGESPPGAMPSGAAPLGTTPPGVTPGSPPSYGSAVPISMTPSPSSGNDTAFWATGDAIGSWFRGVTLPPLVTTSPPGTAKTSAGIIGAPGTTILFGGNQAEDGVRVGFRAAAGYWFGADRSIGIEAGYMVLGSQSSTFNASSANNPILGRPYVDATSFTNQAVLVAFPGTSTGSITIDSNSGHFYSGNFDFAAKLLDDGMFRVVGLAGYRFFRFDESLGIQQTINPTTAVVPAGTRIDTVDGFGTRNFFNGLDIGVRPQFNWESLSLEMLLRVGVGNLHHTVNITGTQTINSPGFAPVVETGGVYALATNIGQHSSNDWVVVPEVGANLSWRLTSNVQLRIGYGLLYLNSIARAPDQVNQIINPNRFPGLIPPIGTPGQPTFYLNRTDLWIQNVNVGVTVTY